jgi:hypothetical protein
MLPPNRPARLAKGGYLQGKKLLVTTTLCDFKSRPPDRVIRCLSLFLNLEENGEKEVVDGENDDHGIVIEEGDEGGILGRSSSTAGTDQDTPTGEYVEATPDEEKGGPTGDDDDGGAPTAAVVKRRLTPFLKQMQIVIRRHKLLHRSRPAAAAAANKDCATCQLTSINDPQILANQARSDRCLKFLDSHSQSAESYCAKYWRAAQLKVSAKRCGPHRPENTASGGVNSIIRGFFFKVSNQCDNFHDN